MQNNSLSKSEKMRHLSDVFFKEIDFSLLRDNFIDEVWEDEEIQKIAAKVEIIDDKPVIEAPFGANHGRFPDLKYVVNKVCEEHCIENCKFIVLLNDAYTAKFPAFSIIRPQKSSTRNIPFPMGNVRGKREGHGSVIEGWDNYIQETIIDHHEKYPWESKIKKAFFRGQFAFQTWKIGEYGKTKAKHWKDVNRGHLYSKCVRRKDIFDVGFVRTNKHSGVPISNPMPFVEQQKYKYIISVGLNVDWAERVRGHMFTNSVLVMHEAEAIEWFYPLMNPWEHYIPFNTLMEDLKDNIEWARNNDDQCRQIVENANKFAKEYLSEKTMIDMAAILIKDYSKYYNGKAKKEISYRLTPR